MESKVTSTIIKSIPKYIDWILELPPLSEQNAWDDTSIKSARIVKKIEQYLLPLYADFDSPEMHAAHHTLLLTACLSATFVDSESIRSGVSIPDADLRRIVFAVFAGLKAPGKKIPVSEWRIWAMSEVAPTEEPLCSFWLALTQDNKALFEELFPLLEKALPKLFRGQTFTDLGERFFKPDSPFVQIPEARPVLPHSANSVRNMWVGLLTTNVFSKTIRAAILSKSPSIQLSNEVLDGIVLRGANLSDFSFENCDLRFANFDHANLKGCKFNKSLLQNASFCESNLQNTHFENACLWRANFEKSDLRDASLNGADLRNVNFTDANMLGATIAGAKLVGANFTKVCFRTAQFSSLDLSHACLVDADLSKSVFLDACLEHANFTGATLTQCTFENANLRHTCFVGADLQNVEFTGADLTAADLSSGFGDRYAWSRKPVAQLSGANFSGVDLHNAKVSAVNFTQVGLRNVDLSMACLEGTIFKSADLQGANLSHANLRNADLGSADLQNTNFNGACLENVQFSHAALSSETNFSDARLKGAHFEKTNLEHANFDNAMEYELAILPTKDSD